MKERNLRIPELIAVFTCLENLYGMEITFPADLAHRYLLY